MSATALVSGDISSPEFPGLSLRTQQFGAITAELSPGPTGVVTFPRKQKPPLRFKGCRWTRHWTPWTDGALIEIELWKQSQKGFVVAYSVLDAGEIETRVIQISDLDEASDCIENVCTNLCVNIGAPADTMTFWTDLHASLCFKQRFSELVADVLSDWNTLSLLQEQPR